MPSSRVDPVDGQHRDAADGLCTSSRSTPITCTKGDIEAIQDNRLRRPADQIPQTGLPDRVELGPHLRHHRRTHLRLKR
ncbi:hypothetical protein [Dactylosporangium salmoneum]|uniref:Uncharacterized protein n=1 Tax=Dactylosporangium salmoneum TaxID=53361 RepID=A0ABP5UEC1_9ACTN